MDEFRLIAERQEDGSLLVARGITPDGQEWVIDLTTMLFNFRVHVTYAEDYGRSYLHGYCYFGRDPATYHRALTAALNWAEAGPLTTEPPGYDKEAY